MKHHQSPPPLIYIPYSIIYILISHTFFLPIKILSVVDHLQPIPIKRSEYQLYLPNDLENSTTNIIIPPLHLVKLRVHHLCSSRDDVMYGIVHICSVVRWVVTFLTRVSNIRKSFA